MFSGLFGIGSVTQSLRGGLDETTATHKAIADRIARGLGQSSSNDFGGQLDASLAKTDQDLTRDMAALVDTELRFEAQARLLQRSYADLRTAIRDRG